MGNTKIEIEEEKHQHNNASIIMLYFNKNPKRMWELGASLWNDLRTCFRKWNNHVIVLSKTHGQKKPSNLSLQWIWNTELWNQTAQGHRCSCSRKSLLWKKQHHTLHTNKQQHQGQSTVLECSDTFCGDEFKGNAIVLLYSTHYLVSCDSLSESYGPESWAKSGQKKKSPELQLNPDDRKGKR